MGDDHEKWRTLALAYEDLSPAQIRIVDRHLASCASCRSLLATIRRVERSAGPGGSIPSFATGEVPWRSPRERDAAGASLARLRQRLGIARPDVERASALHRPREAWSPETPRGWYRRPARSVMLATAAAMAVLVVLRLSGDERRGGPGSIGDLEIVPLARPRGDATAGISHAWHRGDAFTVRFTIAKPSHPVVVRLDARGEVTLLHPEDPAAPILALSGGVVELPSTESETEWVLEGDAGPQALFVSLAFRPDVDLPAILAHLRDAALRGASHAARARSVVSLLETRVGPVSAIDVDVLP